MKTIGLKLLVAIRFLRLHVIVPTALITFISSLNAVNAGYQPIEYTIIITPDHFPIVFPKRNEDGDPVDYGEPQSITAAELLNTDICYASANCSTEALAAGAVYYKVITVDGVQIIFYYDEQGKLIGTQKVSDIVDANGVSIFNHSLVGTQNSNSFNPAPTVDASAVEAAFPTNHTAYMVGSTNASFEVGPSGAASYTIPIVTPPAINGLVPELAISYNSQGGNGLLGVGFSISGLSAISRCPTTKVQDWPTDIDRPINKAVNYSNDDAFCLDGQRLILVDGASGEQGAEYRTEIETFSRITITDSQTSNPTAFKVETKSGQTFFYDRNIRLKGHQTNAALNNTKTLLWPVRQIRDIADQEINFTYTENEDGSTGFRPNQITYGGTNPTTITFNYFSGDRSDSSTGYSHGYTLSSKKLMSDVTVSLGSNNIRQYRLVYDTGTTGKKRISSVMECGTGSIANQADTDNCLPPITYNWTDGPTGLIDAGQLVSSSAGGLADNPERFKIMDLDEDGYSDFLIGPTSGGTWYSVKGETGKLSPGSTLATGLHGGWHDNLGRIRSIDMEGDGAQEILIGPTSGGSWYISKYDNGEDITGNKFQSAGSVSGMYGSWFNKHEYIHVIDLNGDGKQDLLIGPDNDGDWHAMKSSGQTFSAHSNYINGSHAGFGSAYKAQFHYQGIWGPKTRLMDHQYFVDADGDGLTDIMLGPGVSGRWDILKSTGNGFTYHTNYTTSAPGILKNYTCRTTRGDDVCSWSYSYNERNAKNIRFMDVNGDGLQDMVLGPRDNHDSDEGRIYVKLNTGDGFKAQTTGFNSNKFQYWDNDPNEIRPLDVNADGLMDLVLGPNSNGNWHWLKSTGTGFIDKGVILNAYSSYHNDSPETHVGDFDGDGLADLVLSPTGSSNSWYGIKPNGGHPDKLIGIQNGPSPKTTINYELLTHGGTELFTKGTTDTDTEKSIVAPMMVVQSVSKGDGIGGINTTSYQYEDLRVNREGRGISGFAKVTVTDTSTETNIETEIETQYAQNFPFTGMPLYSEKRVNDQRVENVTKSYVSKDTHSGVYYPVNYENATESYEPGSNTAYKKVTVKTGEYPNNDPCNTPGYSCRPASSVEFDNLDNYGNIKWMQTKTESGGETWTQLTESTYLDPGTSWNLGRLKTTQVTHSTTATDVTGTTISNIVRYSIFDYDAKGQLISETIEPNATDPSEKKITTYTYDQYGLKNSVTEQGWMKGGMPLPVRTASTSSQNTSGGIPSIITTVTNHLGETEKTWINRLHGGQTIHEGPNGKQTHTQYDTLGRAESVTNSLGVTTTTTYAWTQSEPLLSVYKITKQTSGLEDQASVYYDALGREIRTTTKSLNGRNVIKETLYNHRGLIETANRPYLAYTTPVWLCFEYDDLGRVTQQNAPGAMNGSPNCDGGNRATSGTLYNGLTTTLTDALGHVKVETRNVMDKVTRIDEAVGTTDQSGLDYYYDAVGNLKTVKDANGKQTTLSYDKNGRKIAMDDPTMGQWTYQYNSFDELTKQTDAKGQTVTMQYDILGRMFQRNDSEGLWNWVYTNAFTKTSEHPIGKLKRVAGPNGYSKAFTYTDKLQPKSTTEIQNLSNGNFQVLTQSFTYDFYGRVATQTQPGGFKVEHEYNIYGHLVAVKSPYQFISAEAQAKLESKKAEAEQKAAAAEALATSYMSQAYSYQQKAIEYENYARSLLQKEGYEIREFYNETGITDFLIGKPRASKLYQAANDLRDISIELINQANTQRGLALTVANIAASSTDLPIATGHRNDARLHAETAIHKLEKAKSIVRQFRDGVAITDYWGSQISTYTGANSMMQFAEDMLTGAQGSYSKFQDQIALAERYETYAAGINTDLSGPTATTWWRAEAADAEGRVTRSLYGNGNTTERDYDPNTGQLLSIITRDGVQTLQHLTYTYDNLNNVTLREDNVLNYDESYTYDALDRLKSATLSVDSIGTPATRNYTYNKVGDIKTLGDKNLTYDMTQNTGRLDKVNGGDSFGYDDNGNMTTLTDGRTVDYTSFNKPELLSKGTASTQFTYNSERSRILKVNRENGIVINSTVYFGGYEKLVDATGNLIEERFNISAGGALIAVHSRTDSNSTGVSNYLHKDALGSTDLITDATGAQTERLGYTPFGTRRNLAGLASISSYISFSIYLFNDEAVITKRGFTGHEHIDELDLIHMNGRVYDPSIGRFLSPDPHVQIPKSTQGFNRYAYVQNNPLKYTDPSGYFLKSLARSVKGFVKKYGVQILVIVVAFYTGQWALAANWGVAGAGFAAGFVGGLLGSGGDIKAALMGGMMGAVTAGIGQGAFRQGLAQGTFSEMRGGRFKDGFLGGVGGTLFPTPSWLPSASNMSGGAIALRTAYGAMTGGIVSEMGGGKFKNGAASGAFARLLTEGARARPNKFEGTGGGVAYVGGAADSLSDRVYKKYLADSSLDKAYFTYDQKEALTIWVQEHGSTGTIKAHSWGADMAVEVIASGNYINNIETFDPVGWIRPNFADVNNFSGNWTNYNAVGRQPVINSIVTTVGQRYGNAVVSFPDNNFNLNKGHVGILKYM